MSDKKDKELDSNSYLDAVTNKVDDSKAKTQALVKRIPTEKGIKQITLRHRAICQMAALGFTPKHISEQIGISKERVSAILRSESGKAAVIALQNELFFKDPRKMFLAEVPRAFRKLKKVLHSDETRDSDILKAADMVFDRAMGKPTQEIHHEGSAIRQLFEALDAKNNPKVIEVESKVVDAEFKEVSKEEQKDEMDQWLDDNL